MIEINVLPEELKIKAKKIGIEPRQILYFIPLVFLILVIIHIYLAGTLIIRNFRLNALNNKWHNLEPQRKTWEDFQREYVVLSDDAKVIQQLISQRINWSEKLNKLSLQLPYGVWFNEISLTSSDLILRGSVISLQKEEMNLINKFMDNLKNDTGFFKDFNTIELSSIQRKVIGGYDVIDFNLAGKLKSR